MRIHNKTVVDIESGQIIFDDSLEYSGQIAHCGGGGGDTNMVIYTNLLPSYIPGFQDEAVTYLNQSLVLSMAEFTEYSGQTYAAQNADELAGIEAVASRGWYGDSIESDGETYLQLLFNDGYIGINPRLDTAFQKGQEVIIQGLSETILPDIDDSYMFAFGGSEHNIAQAKAAEKAMDSINALGEKIYYDDYRTERRIQDAGLSHAVPYGQRGIRDGEILRSAGLYAREFLQGFYTDKWKVWNENEIVPIRNLDIIGNAVRSILGVTRTATTKYYKPPAFNEIAGAALTGLGFYSAAKRLTMSAYDNPAGKVDLKQSKLDYYMLDNWMKDNWLKYDNQKNDNPDFNTMKDATPQDNPIGFSAGEE
jgi:hypothetical protein